MATRTGASLDERWIDDEPLESLHHHVRDSYDEAENADSQWSSTSRRPWHSTEPSGQIFYDSDDACCDFLRLVTAISQTYEQGNYIRMRSLDGYLWQQLGAGASFQVSQSDLLFDVVTGRNYRKAEQIRNRVIIKRTRARGAQVMDDVDRRSFVRELRILHHFNGHDNIVSLRGVGWFYEYSGTTPSPKPLVILEVADHTLDFLIKGTAESEAQGSEQINLSPETMLGLFSDITNGLKAIHSCDIVHGDVKPANVLIFNRNRIIGGIQQAGWNAKISDFSLAMFAHPQGRKQKVLGTVGWMAPETSRLLSFEEMKSTDTWSLGLLFASVLCCSLHVVPRENVLGRGAHTLCAEIADRFERKIESSSWTDDINTPVRHLYLDTVQVDPSSRSLLRLHEALEEWRPTRSDAISRKSLRSISVKDLTVNYEGFKTLSGSVKDAIYHGLTALSSDNEDPRRPSALYELGIICLSKYARPDNFITEGLTFLCQAADLGHIQAKALYGRLRSVHEPELLLIHDAQSSTWLYQAACEGHQIAMLDLADLQSDQAQQAQRVAAEASFDAAQLAAASSSPSILHKYISSYLSFKGIMSPNEWFVSASGDTPTHWAAATGHAQALIMLLQVLHVDANLRNAHGDTPLILACRYGQYDTVIVLLEADADAKAQNNVGETVFHFLHSFTADEGRDLFERFQILGVDSSLDAKGTRPNCKLEMFPTLPGHAIERAAVFNRADLVEMFLQTKKYHSDGNVFRRLFLWAVRLLNVDIQRSCRRYAQQNPPPRGSSLLGLKDTKWIHQGRERSLIEAACLGWISAEGQGLALPIEFWMQCCHGPNWVSRFRATVDMLCEMADDGSEIEIMIDQGLTVSFESRNHTSFSILLDWKAEITNGDLSRAESLEPLAWRTVYATEGLFDNRLQQLDMKNGDKGKHLDEILPLSDREIPYADQVFHNHVDMTLAQQSILSGDRTMFHLLVRKFGANLTLPINHIGIVDPVVSAEIPQLLRTPPMPRNQFNCYGLLAYAPCRDLWFAQELKRIHIELDCPFDEAPLTEKFYFPPLFYALHNKFWGYALWLLKHGATFQQNTSVRSTVLQHILSPMLVNTSLLEFLFPKYNDLSNLACTMREATGISSDAFGGYMVFRLFYDCVTGGRFSLVDFIGMGNFMSSDLSMPCFRNMHMPLLYARAIQPVPAAQKRAYILDYLKTCQRVKECWMYLLREFPHVQNSPTLKFYRISYKPLSILDQSLRLFSDLRATNLSAMKLQWMLFGVGMFLPVIPFPDDLDFANSPERTYDLNDETQHEALENVFEKLEPHVYRGLDTFQLTIDHYLKMERWGQPFPHQSWQSLLFGSPLDLLSIRAIKNNPFRSLENELQRPGFIWLPSICHPFVGYVIGVLLFLGLFFYVGINFIINQLSFEHLTLDFWDFVYVSTVASLELLMLFCMVTRYGLRIKRSILPSQTELETSIRVGELSGKGIIDWILRRSSVGRSQSAGERLDSRLSDSVRKYLSYWVEHFAIEQTLFALLLVVWFLRAIVWWSKALERPLEMIPRGIQPVPWGQPHI